MTYNNRFTEKAQEALRLAQQSAAELGQNYIGSEHLLMGLCQLNSCVANSILEQYGVTADKVKEKIISYFGEGGGVMENNISFTPRTKRILEISQIEAMKMGHSFIGIFSRL